MGLTDLFRPRHRHSDASVRADAVRQMGPDDADLLANIARDDRDVSVRRLAIDKVDDPGVLVAIARDESDRGLRERANSRAAEIWVDLATSTSTGDAESHDIAAAEQALAGLFDLGNQKAIAEVASRTESDEVLEMAMARLQDDKALAELARSSSTPVSARSTAIARIDDPEVLRSIAIDERRKDIALAVLDRLEDPAILEAITAKAKNKAARTRARKKLAELNKNSKPSVSPEAQRAHAERVQLVRRGEKLARGNEWQESPAAMDEIEAAWQALGETEDDPGLRKRFEQARDRYRRRQKAHDEAVARREAEKASRSAASDGDAAAAESAPAEAEAGSDGEAEGQGEEVAAGGDGGDGESAPGAEGGEGSEGGEDGEALARQEAEKKERDEERRRQRQERQQRDLDALGELLTEIESTLEARKFRASEKMLQKADKTFASLKLPDEAGDQVQRYQDLRQNLFIQVRELRDTDDWQRWANVPHKKALITRAQALLADEDDSKLGERLKALQAEWKKVGPVPRKQSQELWNEFKGVCDQVYARVKTVRARLSEEYAGNLVRKRELCERVEGIADSTEWDQTADEIKALQREWRTIGPVPRKQSDAIWKRFRAACDHFFERRKPHVEELMAERTKNLEAKTELCDRAESLAESSDWSEAATEIRALQREWREIGPVPRKDFQEIGKRFRTACDRFFERRQAHRDEQERARRQKMDEILVEIEAVMAVLSGSPAGPVQATEPARAAESPGVDEAAADTEPGDEAVSAAEPGDEAASETEPQSPAQRALAVSVSLRELEMKGKEGEPLFSRANELFRAILEQQPDAFDGTALEPSASQSKKSKLLARAEEIAPRPQQSGDGAGDQSAEQVAQALRAALAQNALSASLAESTDARAIADEIAFLKDSWMRIGPVPGSEGDDLESRFRSACERAQRIIGAG